MTLALASYVSLSHVQLRSVNFEGRDETYASRIVHRDESLSSKNYPLILLELLCIFFFQIEISHKTERGYNFFLRNFNVKLLTNS